MCKSVQCHIPCKTSEFYRCVWMDKVLWWQQKMSPVECGKLQLQKRWDCRIRTINLEPVVCGLNSLYYGLVWFCEITQYSLAFAVAKTLLLFRFFKPHRNIFVKLFQQLTGMFLCFFYSPFGKNRMQAYRTSCSKLSTHVGHEWLFVASESVDLN